MLKENLQHKKEYDLRTDPVPKLFLHYSLLSIAGLSAMSINIMLDGIFIGRFVGSMGLAAINLVLPVFPILLAIGMCFGYGAAALAGISFGRGDNKEANEIFNQAFWGVLIVSVLATVLMETFAEPIVTALGATALLRDGVSIYFRTFTFFAGFFCLTLFFEPMVRNDGSPRKVMLSLILGACTNACLDALFIVGLGMGLFGAALATGLAQVASCAYLLSHYGAGHGKLRFARVSLSFSRIITVFRTGCPALATQICQALFIIIYNHAVLQYMGELGVAAVGVILYMNELVMLCNYGFGEALQPIASFNLGAAAHDRMRKTFYTAAGAALAVAGFLTIFIQWIPGFFVGFFTREAELTALAVEGMRIYYGALLVQSFNMVVIYYLGAVRRPLESTVLALIRNLGSFLAAIAILPGLLGKLGVWLAIPAAELLSFLFVCGVIFFNRFYFKGSRS